MGHEGEDERQQVDRREHDRHRLGEPQLHLGGAELRVGRVEERREDQRRHGQRQHGARHAGRGAVEGEHRLLEAGRHERQAENQQQVAEDAADDRRLDQLHHAGAECDDCNDQLGGIAEGRVEEAPHRRTGALGQVFRGLAEELGEREDGQAGEAEDQHRLGALPREPDCGRHRGQQQVTQLQPEGVADHRRHAPRRWLLRRRGVRRAARGDGLGLGSAALGPPIALGRDSAPEPGRSACPCLGPGFDRAAHRARGVPPVRQTGWLVRRGAVVRAPAVSADPSAVRGAPGPLAFPRSGRPGPRGRRATRSDGRPSSARSPRAGSPRRCPWSRRAGPSANAPG